MSMPPAMERFMLARFRNLRIAFAAERGSFLVEVMVGAIVLAITTTAVLSGLDGAQDTGRRNKDRSELSTLAQQDLERLRSIPITSLSNYDETRTVRVATVDYTVHSTTEWVRDASGVVSCTDDNTQAEYMKVSSTVTSPASVNNPVTETTILTPAPGAFSATAGTAAVLVTDRDGNPRAGVTVALSGAGSYSDSTNSLGCAIFGYIPSGAYTATISGMVAWASDLPATAAATVNPGRTTLIQMEVEPPASLRALFKTPSGTPVVGPETPTPSQGWNKISVVHSKLPAGIKFFPSATATLKGAAQDATELYPHRDGYGVYAGSCASNNPASWLPSYFGPTSGLKGYIKLDPGDNLKNVDVIMPTLTLTITKRNLALSRYHVMIKQIDTPDCTELMWDYSTAVMPTDTSEAITFPVPFGRYKVCVDDGVGNRYRVSTAFPTPTPNVQVRRAVLPITTTSLPPTRSLRRPTRVNLTSTTPANSVGVCNSLTFP